MSELQQTTQELVDGIRNEDATEWLKVIKQYVDSGLDPEPAITGSCTEVMTSKGPLRRPEGREAASRAFVAGLKGGDDPTPVPAAPAPAPVADRPPAPPAGAPLNDGRMPASTAATLARLLGRPVQ